VTAIRAIRDSDVDDVTRIYNHYIETSIATFETEPLAAIDMSRRVRTADAASLPFLVAESMGDVIGYAYASRWKARQAYRYTVETTIYLDSARTGLGAGRLLYSALLDELRRARFHTALGGIALPNEASVRLHEKLGFRKVGVLAQVGFKLGRWVDVGYWQLWLDAEGDHSRPPDRERAP